jgi:hypothetical protein
MNFPSIDIQGSILSTDLLSKIRSEQATFQSGKDFRPDFTNAKLKDEISFAWQEAKGQWTIYKSKLARLRSGELGTTETRNFWISPLLTNLGYNLTFNRQAEDLNGKLFSIGYRDTTLDGFPIYAGGYHESLDKRPENKQIRMSPHALVQEYLNYSEHLYGIVTNGRQLRLLRDASRITRLSYVEFNLEKMMEEDLYSDFVLLYRLLHASRMPRTVATGPDSIIEKYHQDGLEAGSTIRNKLGSAVKKAIQDLANAFINHPNNEELRDGVKANKLNLDEYYKLQLRIIYRLLFLFVIEERNLVYADSKTAETKRFNEIYFKHYSLIRLRRLAKKLAPPESHRHFDLWRSVVSTFSLFEKKQVGEKLGIMSLQGDLFGYNSLTTSSYDLHECDVSNAVILQIIRSLTYFENEQGVLIAVNYGGLDVEEFGSVYEGLLELKLAIKDVEGTNNFSFSFDSSNERGTSGSHYTPEELVQPLIKNSLDYLIADKLKEKDAIKALLSLKIVDVACGSGHILLSAARRIAHELASLVETQESGSKERVEQPSPGYVRKALKEVVRNCIYGVDKNPLAVELCKVALWLEAYNPGEPLNFLDHHIKCGDAIVGLAFRSQLDDGIPDEAFKTLLRDDKDIAKSWRERNVNERKQRESNALQLKAEFDKTTENSVQEAMAEYKTFNQLPESTPEEIERKTKLYKKFIDGKGVTFLKAMADTQTAQFFIPKTNENKDALMTDGDYRMILSGYNKSWQDRKVAISTTVALNRQFFHWFIEFPEVFQNGGFDCVLGNPPYLGGKKISGAFNDEYLQYLYSSYPVVGGLTDLIAYFLLRIYGVLAQSRYLAIITTNSINRGDTKDSGLKIVDSYGGRIIYAVSKRKWPGTAQTHVSILSIKKGALRNEKILLDEKDVDFISPEFEATNSEGERFRLLKNADMAFMGSNVLGEGFVISEEEYNRFKQNALYSRFVFPYINGDDFNNEPNLIPPRYIVNFGSVKIEEASKYTELFALLKERVYPDRQLKKDKGYREKWWLHARPAKELYASIKENRRILCRTQASKHNVFEFLENGFVYDQKLIVFKSESYGFYSLLNSSIHECWFWRCSGDLGGTTLNYSPSSVWETFPQPQNVDVAELIGEQYHSHRIAFMVATGLGLTKTYNLFHYETLSVATEDDFRLDDKEFGKKYGREASSLKRAHTRSSYNKIVQDILTLRHLHIKIDEAILKAYGWTDIDPTHGFYDVEYLPEKDRRRFTIHPQVRKEILKRLLELNHKIHDNEENAGLLGKKKSVAKAANTEVNEPDIGYGSLFEK